MSALLDLDDVVAGNPAAQRELESLRAQVATLTAELARVKALVDGAEVVMYRRTFNTGQWEWIARPASQELIDQHAYAGRTFIDEPAIMRPNLNLEQKP